MQNAVNIHEDLSQFSLAGKRALVTGGSRCIGRWIAHALAKAGADVAITSSRDKQSLDETASLVEMTGRRCIKLVYDVGDPAAARHGVDEASEALGGLDILVNNAGIGSLKHILDVDLDYWGRMMDVNLNGPFVTSQRAAQIMRSSGGGAIINICSIGSLGALPEATPYSVSKAALEMLTKGMAMELAADGVRVNAIAPGYFETEMTEILTSDVAWVKKTLAETPANRFGGPEDIGGVAVFLASPAAAFIHGVTLLVDGGRTAKA